jgi:hydroxymethylbilane synthase
VHELVIAARSSPLSRWQAEAVADMLRNAHHDLIVRIDYLTTTGDRILDSPLSAIGDKGLFTKELEVALLEKRADIAVHSLKDVQTTLPHGLVLAAVTRRHHVEDVLVAPLGATLDGLPKGATVATGSLRRRAQLLALRSDIDVVDVRGNVGTRLRRMDEEGWSGMILARAGLERLGLAERIAQVIPPDRMIPAVGQGALGIEARSTDAETLGRLEAINHAETREATDAERTFMRVMEGGCQVPMGAWARQTDEGIAIDGVVASLDGATVLRAHVVAHDPVIVGELLARKLLDDGAASILSEVRAGEAS